MENERYHREYEEMMRKSMSGSAIERQNIRRQRREEKMRKEEKMRRIKRIIVAAGFSLLVAASPALVHAFSDNLIIDSMTSDFKLEVIAPETHRTNDKEHYYYDYEDIASYLNSMEDFDEGVYLLNLNVGDYQTGKVLEFTDYHSFTEYKERNGYQTTDDFRKAQRKRIIDKTNNKDEIETMITDEEIELEENQRTGEK